VTEVDVKLDALRRALAGCRACGLRDRIRPIVSQARTPRVMLVGQAPGKVEAEGGRPFAGRAGKTLFAWFAGVGLDEATLRDRMYIAAVTRCFPGAHPSGRGDRVPSPAERANCAQWLEQELAIIRPRLVIPVGRLAIDALLGPMPLDRAIGREHRIGDQAIVAVPLPHPSGASSWIHAPGHRALVDAALERIRRHWDAIHRRSRAA
jgi:uracil-DNA glycosylase